MHPDLTPATETLARVVTGIADDQLAAPTPCRGTARRCSTGCSG